MARVTPKENMLKLLGGEMPYYVPFYSLTGDGYMGERPIANADLPIWSSTRHQNGGYDIWGVRYAAPEVGITATMPDPRIILLEDIEDWTSVIKMPVANDIDYEACAAKALEGVDRNETLIKSGPGFSPFQVLVALMGFEGGLISLATDPDEVSAMLNAMVDHMEPYYTKMFEALKPDIITIADDTAAEITPFFSPATYEKVFLPIYKRLVKYATDRGLPVEFHNCGRCQDFYDFMVQFGVRMTDPAQESNDLLYLKEKYKGKIALAGCFSWAKHIPANWPDFDEEELRQDVRNTIDKYSVGGGYAFAGWPIGVAGDPGVPRALRILRDECHFYGKKVYGYTGE